MKKTIGLLCIVCIISLFVGYMAATAVYASNNKADDSAKQKETSGTEMLISKDSQKIELNDNSYMLMDENEEKRLVLLYENESLLQIAILYKETGDIYYYDMSQQAVSSLEDATMENYTEKYNIRDFLVYEAEE